MILAYLLTIYDLLWQHELKMIQHGDDSLIINELQNIWLHMAVCFHCFMNGTLSFIISKIRSQIESNKQIHFSILGFSENSYTELQLF